MRGFVEHVRDSFDVRRLLCSLSGIVLYALALDLFLVGNNIAAGGISGIAIVLTQYVSISVGALIFVMNVPILIAALLMNGWKYSIGAIFGAVLYSFTTEVFSEVPSLTQNPLVASVYGGVVYGAGMALLTLGNGSTGGTDLLSRLCVKKLPSLSVGKMSVFIDGSVVLFSIITFGNIEVGLYAIITIAVCSLVSDRIILGFERGSLCVIITQKQAHVVANPLMKELGRAVTQLPGIGMYTDEERSVLLIAVRPREGPKVKAIVKQVAPDAFVMLIQANELIGANFKMGVFGSRHP